MRFLQLIGAFLILFASPAIAGEGSAAWIVAQKSGDVRVLRNGMQPASAQVRSALSPGDIVATGVNGRAMLTRGSDYVVVAPGSRLLLPKEEQQKGFTRLIQQVGTMLYKVRHTGVPHFAVETPMLAAVVKGTSFTVIVEDDRAAVQVTEGLVEVSSATGSARRLVEKGMTVYVGRERPDAIIEMKPGAANLPGPDGDAVKIETSGEVPLATITNLTGGLVRATPTAPVVAVATVRSPAVVINSVSGTTAPAAAAPVANAETNVTGVAKPVVGLVQTTVPAVVAPVTDTVPTVTAPVIDTVTTVAAPVVDTVATVTAPVVDTVATVTAPVIDTVAPVIDTVTTVAAPVIDTVTTVTAPVIDTVTTVAAPVIDTVATVTAPVVDTVTTVAAPVIDTVATVTAPVVEPITTVTAPIIEPITTVTAPVIEPVTTVTAPIVAPVLKPVVTTVPVLGSLLKF